MRALALILCCGIGLAGDLAEKVQQAIDSTPGAGRGHFGILVTDAATGEVVLEKDSAKFFAPGSNTKLFSSALALFRLGPDFRFRTRVVASSAPDRAGRIHGDVSLVGGGDPNLSGRAVPYQPDAEPGDPLAVMEDLAGQMAARGVTRIDGSIVGDDTIYPYDPYPDGWTLEDTNRPSGAPVSALAFNDNAVLVTLLPGDPAGIRLTPAMEYFTFDNRVFRGSPTRVRWDRAPGSRHVRITGRLRPNSAGETARLAVDDPALFAAAALRDALQRQGIAVDGQAVARHWLPGQAAPPKAGGVRLAERESAPLGECLRVVNKVSQNLHAELMLSAVAYARRGRGTRDAGMVEMRQFIAEAGIPPEEFGLVDGSGLSRRNLITPSAVHKLLRYVYDSPYRDLWMGLLPVGGEDGTLKNRFKGTAAQGVVRAKTGTLSRVAALGGYLDRPDGSRWIFSVIANFQPDAPAALIDKLVLILLE
ncbi:MAG: D-alanyl-D-alanine carboxypeptidase/D-alanyl-D-alanine-endopeptidase [Bryobacteraceae bacterium]